MGPGKYSTPKKREGPAAADAFQYELKQMPTQELQQMMSSLQQEMKSRQDASLGSAHDVSAVLQTLLKKGHLGPLSPSFLLSVGRWPREKCL